MAGPHTWGHELVYHRTGALCSEDRGEWELEFGRLTRYAVTEKSSDRRLAHANEYGRNSPTMNRTSSSSVSPPFSALAATGRYRNGWF